MQEFGPLFFLKMEMEAREKEWGLGIVVENGGGYSHEHGVFCERLLEGATVGKVNIQQVSELEEGEIPVLENHLNSSLGSWVEKKFADGKNTELVQSKEQGNPSFNGSLASPTPDDISRIPIEGKENGSEVEEEEEEEDEDDMVEEDSDPLMESAADESSDTSDNEEEDEVEVNDTTQKHNRDRATELEKLVVGGDEESGDEEVISMEPPRTTHELKELPPVPKINAVLELHHTPQSVGTISSVFSKQVIVEATDHKLVLNEGSILWLTDQRIPLGIVDEVFGPVKKPYYVVRYNEVVDIPEGATPGKDVAFVSELANFVQDDPELWKKGYDASGEHDEELSEVEFSDDEKEEEMKRAAKKRSHLVQGTGSSGRRGGRGGQAGSGDRSRGWRGRGQRGCGRGRDFRTESPETPDGAETVVQQMASMGSQSPNFHASPIHHAERRARYEQPPRNPFQPSPERRDSWNRNTRPESNYHPQSRPLVVPYSDHQPLLYQQPPPSPHHEFVPGRMPMQQQQEQQLSSQGPPPPQWGPPVRHVQGLQAYQSYPVTYLASTTTVGLPPGPDTAAHFQQGGGGFRYPGHIYQKGVGLAPQTPYLHPTQMNMYAPIPSHPTGTGTFIAPTKYTTNSQSGQFQGLSHSDMQGRGTAVNIQVTGIPCYSTPAAPVYLQQQGVLPHLVGSAPGPSNGPSNSVYDRSNNTSR